MMSKALDEVGKRLAEGLGRQESAPAPASRSSLGEDYWEQVRARDFIK